MSEALLSLVVATVLLLGSPGPATLALAGVGAACGFKAGLPFLAGILSGLCVVIIATTLGLASLFETWPTLRITVQLLGGCYILYIAFKVATAPLSSEQNLENGPLNFRDGFFLNLLNPKAYAAFLALFSQFLLPIPTLYLAYIFSAIVCFLVALIVDAIWLLMGEMIRPWFQQPRLGRLIRLIFAASMVLAVMWSLFQSSH